MPGDHLLRPLHLYAAADHLTPRWPVASGRWEHPLAARGIEAYRKGLKDFTIVVVARDIPPPCLLKMAKVQFSRSSPVHVLP